MAERQRELVHPLQVVDKDESRLEWDEDPTWLAEMAHWIEYQQFATGSDLASIATEERELVAAEIKAAWRDYRNPIVRLGVRALRCLNPILRGAPPELKASIERPVEDLRAKVGIRFTHDRPSRSEVIDAIERVLHEAALWLTCQPSEKTQSLLGPLNFVQRLREEIDERAHVDYSTAVYAEGMQSPCNAVRVDPVLSTSTDAGQAEDTQAHIISAGIATLMTADLRIVVYGEDVGHIGGVLGSTLGLQKGRSGIKDIRKDAPAIARYMPEYGFGEERVWDHGIAENAIVGTAVGMSLRGLLPIAEIQFLDYLVWALQQIVDEVASLRHRTDGGQACPMLIRTPGHREMGMWHSGSPLGMVLSSCPGLRVLVPRNGVQAVAMYRAVLASGDPALSVEPLARMRLKETVPENLDEICLPLGQSEILRHGTDVTIVTYGFCCEVAIEAAANLALRGIEVEVVDLQTLNPLDLNRVAEESIKRTGAALFLDEDIPEGATAIIAKALMFDRGLFWDDEKPEFVTAPHHKPPYGTDGKFFTKPQARDVIAAVLRMKVVVHNASKRRGKAIATLL